MQTQPQYIRESCMIGDANVDLKGETWDGQTLDIEVKINGKLLCWISWDQKEEFLSKLNTIISEYRI